MEERFHFPLLEAETRSKSKFTEIRIATLERMLQKLLEKRKELSENSAPNDFDIFQPVPQFESSIVFMRGISMKQRIPSCVIPNGSAPIKTQGSMVPKEVQIITRTAKAPKKHEVIKTPDYREITEEENPQFKAGDQIPQSHTVTDSVTQKIIQTHQQLELIEDMVRLGAETRVTGPGSLLRVYNLHEDYKYDKKELRKIQKYTSKDVDTIVPSDWPPRVWDAKNHPITEEQEKEREASIEEWKSAHQASIDAKLAQNKRPTKSSKNPKFKVWVGDFITDASSDVTEDDDFVLGVN